MGPVR